MFKLLGQGLRRTACRLVQLLQPARHFNTGGLVPEVALDLAEDRGGRVCREAGSLSRVVAIQRVDKPDVADWKWPKVLPKAA